MDQEIILECRHVSHSFGEKAVLHDVNLKVIKGEIVALVGPSGCGKSTLLRAIVGTHPPTAGDVVLYPGDATREKVVRGPGRDRGIVYQKYTLFPFLTVLDNVALGPKLDQTSIAFRALRFSAWRRLRKQHLEEAAELLKKLGLESAMHHYPSELSGGMQQRVAIAQALVMKPEILLLDEPFGALDEATREELQDMLLSLYAENVRAVQAGTPPPYTIVIVTHELNEAMLVGDRVAGLSQYWDWKKSFAAFPGATIVYDRVSPVFLPTMERDYGVFAAQKQEIRAAAFNPEVLHEREKFCSFWLQLKEGKGRGVLQNGNRDASGT